MGGQDIDEDGTVSKAELQRNFLAWNTVRRKRQRAGVAKRAYDAFKRGNTCSKKQSFEKQAAKVDPANAKLEKTFRDAGKGDCWDLMAKYRELTKAVTVEVGSAD
jgi:hypothetical protein